RQEEFARKETAHARACKAAALADAEAALQQRRKDAADAIRRLAEARTMLQRADAAKSKADEALAAHVAAEPKREEARQEVDRLGALEEKVLSLAQARGLVRTAAERLGVKA